MFKMLFWWGNTLWTLINIHHSNQIVIHLWTIIKNKKKGTRKEGLYVRHNWIVDVHRSQSSRWSKLFLWSAWPLRLSRNSSVLRLLSLQLFFSCNTPLGSLCKPWPEWLRQLEPVFLFPPLGSLLHFTVYFYFSSVATQSWTHLIHKV